MTAPAKTARLIELVIDGLSVTEAAKEIGVSRRHAYRLISDPEAKAAIARAARESAKSAQLVLQRGAEEAARALVQMGTGRAKATPARVAACKGVLDFVIEKAASTMHLTAQRPDVPPEFTGAATAILQAALEEADEHDATDSETVALAERDGGLRALPADAGSPGPTTVPSDPKDGP